MEILIPGHRELRNDPWNGSWKTSHIESSRRSKRDEEGLSPVRSLGVSRSLRPAQLEHRHDYPQRLACRVDQRLSLSTVTFNLVAGGVATGNSQVSITTAWILASSRANVVLNGYFATASAALSGSASPIVNIPSSEVLGLMPTGTPTTFTAFTSGTALGPAAAGLLLFTQALSSGNFNSSRTDNLSLEINLASQPQLPAASNYTGSLLLQAQAL